MDTVRFGLSIRALRRRRRWTQSELGERSRLSQSAVSRIERGEADHFTVRTLDTVVSALDARLRLTLLSQGEDLDRLLDAGHAALVDAVVGLLRRHGWEVAPETTFAVYGERGSIDVLAFHPPTGSLLVIEVKSTIPDVQATLAGLDRKARLARGIAQARGWRVLTVSRLLVVPGDSNTRRRFARHAATFGAALPMPSRGVRTWLAWPAGAIAGILFLTAATQRPARHRIRA